MSDLLKPQSATRPLISRALLLSLGAGALVLLAIGADTKFVRIGSADDVKVKVFSKEDFGAAKFPEIQKFIVEHAVDAKTLGAAIAADKAEAGKKYGVETGTGAVIPVTLSGVAGEVQSGIYTLTVEGLPEGTKVRVQTGPAVNGTDLRDATGQIAFGQFTNQIEFQDAGSAINNEMKKQVLTKVDNSALAGKTLKVTGVFKLINPKNWLLTPVMLGVE